jgi:hypothetical protein
VLYSSSKVDRLDLKEKTGKLSNLPFALLPGLQNLYTPSYVPKQFRGLFSRTYRASQIMEIVVPICNPR